LEEEVETDVREVSPDAREKPEELELDERELQREWPEPDERGEADRG